MALMTLFLGQCLHEPCALENHRSDSRTGMPDSLMVTLRRLSEQFLMRFVYT